MASFQDLGLREPLLRTLEDEGLERPTALQQAAIPVLRREGNLVARAGSGAGKTLAYGLGVLDRLHPRATEGEAEDGAPPAGPRVLVLSPTPEAAERAALELVPYAQAVDLAVSASGGGWGTAAAEADLLAATPAEVMEAVRSSSVKLEGVEAVVVDGASEIEGLGGWEALETLFDHLPRDAQRVVVTAAATEGVEDLVSRRVKRALRFPAEAASPDPYAPAPEQAGVVGYVPVAGRDKTDVVARLLGGGGDAPPVLYCRTDERAAQLAEALAQRGFLVGEPGDDDADVAVAGPGEAEGPGSGTAISFDVPADEETLRARHGGAAEPGFVLVEPRELGHLREIARRAAFAAQPAGVSGEEPRGAAEVRAFRGQLRRALREEDLAAQMLLLEPLFDDFTPAEVAAAASALLRRRPAEAQEPAGQPAAAAAARGGGERPLRTDRRPPAEAPAGGVPGAFARLFISLGDRDGIRPNDLVGAIAGEADIPGTQIGKIDIRDTFSIVEVPADAAQKVIGALNGTTIRNRSVRVDFDRQRTPGGGKRGPGGPGGPGGPRGGTGGAGGPRGGAGGFRPQRTDRPGGPRGPRPGGGRPPRDGDAPRPFRRPRDE